MNENVELGDFYVIGDIDITIDIPGSGSSTFNLNSPNGDSPFSMELQPIQESKYEDGDGRYRKGYCEYRIILRYGYSSHYMELHKLMVSTNCRIQFPMPFTFLNEFDFIFDNDSVSKKWLADFPITKKTKSRYLDQTGIDTELEEYHNLRDANPMPDGEIELTFKSVKNFTPQEIASLMWFEPVVEPPVIGFWYGDPNTLTDKTAENTGLETITQNAESNVDNLELDTGQYFYVELIKGGFVDRLFRVDNFAQDLPYVEIGESSDGNPVWKVDRDSVGEKYGMQSVKTGDYSNIIEALIKLPFDSWIYTDPISISGEEDSTQSPSSTVQEPGVGVIEATWEFKNYIYIKTDLEDLTGENLSARWRLDSESDFSAGKTLPVSIIYEAHDFARVPVPIYGEIFVVDLVDDNTNSDSRNLTGNVVWGNYLPSYTETFTKVTFYYQFGSELLNTQETFTNLSFI